MISRADSFFAQKIRPTTQRLSGNRKGVEEEGNEEMIVKLHLPAGSRLGDIDGVRYGSTTSRIHL